MGRLIPPTGSGAIIGRLDRENRPCCNIVGARLRVAVDPRPMIVLAGRGCD